MWPNHGPNDKCGTVRFYLLLMYSICDINATSNIDYLCLKIANFLKCQLNTPVSTIEIFLKVPIKYSYINNLKHDIRMCCQWELYC